MREGDNLKAEEWQIKRADGRQRTVLISTFLLESDEAQPLVLAAVRDVTGQRIAERALRLRNDALEKSLNGFDIVDHEGLFLYANEAYLKMWGFESLAEIIGTSPKSHCADSTIPAQIIGKLRQRGEYTLEFTARRKDGSTFEVLMATRLFRDADGNELFMGASLDVTERKKAELKLLQSEEQYRAVYNAVRDALFVGRLDGTIVDVNEAACAMHGYTREELIGTTPFKIIPQEFHHSFNVFIGAICERRTVRLRTRGLRKDGTSFSNEVDGSP
jgi:PAS domain S-box-containing protein